MALQGKYTIWGTQGAGLTWSSGIAKADNKVKRLAVQDNLRVGDARDGAGRIFASSIERDTLVITIDLIPLDNSGTSLATAKGNVKLPPPGAVITLSDTGVDEVDGDWNYIGGGTIEFGESNEVPLTIKGVQLRQVSTDGLAVAKQNVLA